MKIAISSETALDLTKELLAKYEIKTIPFEILLGDKNEFDGNLTCDDIIDFVDKNKILPKTSAVNQYRFEEYFNELRKDYDAVIHFSLSSGISSTCANAQEAAKKVDNVYVVDTLSLSTGIALLVIYAATLRDEGLDAKEIYEKCLARVPAVQASFELKRLDYLYKGGRCSSLAFFGANIFKIRPQIIVKEGKMISGKKYRGDFAKVVSGYCKDVLEEFDTPDLTRAFVTYTTADDSIVEIAVNALKEKGFKEILITRAGGTIASYCGENCLGILYINDGE